MLRKFSLQAQLIIAIIVSLLLVTTALQVTYLIQEQRALVRAERERSQVLIASVENLIEAISPLIVRMEDITELDAQLAALVRGNEGVDFIAVTWPDGTVIFHSKALYKGEKLAALSNPKLDETYRANVPGFGSVYITSASFPNPTEAGAPSYLISVGADTGALDASLIRTTEISLVVGAVVATLMALLTLAHLRANVTAPVRTLVNGARMFRAGRLDYRVKGRGPREFYELADALNDMASELQQSQQRLEAQVRRLHVAADVSRRITTLLDLDLLLRQVIELTQEAFGLYHAHIYLVDETGETLQLAAGAGEPGRIMKEQGHYIPLHIEQSLVAQSARQKSPLVVNDTREDPRFLANPLLPETLSEAAFPLMSGERVLGVLDVQVSQTDFFTPGLVSVLETLAGQVSVAIQNARLFAEVERTGRRERVLNRIMQQVQSAHNIEEVLQAAAQELGRALRAPTVVTLRMPSDGDKPDNSSGEV